MGNGSNSRRSNAEAECRAYRSQDDREVRPVQESLAFPAGLSVPVDPVGICSSDCILKYLYSLASFKAQNCKQYNASPQITIASTYAARNMLTIYLTAFLIQSLQPQNSKSRRAMTEHFCNLLPIPLKRIYNLY